MKNLFNNLMLIAVAAMAFTACTKEQDEVNAVTKKVVVEFVAGFDGDDSRVAFGEKNGDKYPTLWEADDVVKIKIGEKIAEYTLTAEDILNDGQTATLKPEFELLEDETLEGNVVATVNENIYLEVHDGVDPAISLKAEAEYPATNLLFKHQYAYGKMKLVGLPEDFEASRVTLILNGDGKTLNHTIWGHRAKDHTVWFTTEAMESVDSFEVYASDNVTTYGKKVDANGALAFTKGCVSAFSVSGLEKPEPIYTTAFTYYNTPSDWYLNFTDDRAMLDKLVLNLYGVVYANADSWILNEGVYTENSGIHTSREYSKYDGIVVKSVTLTVTYVPEGFHFLIENVKDEAGNVLLEKASFTGSVSGLKTIYRLVTPVVTATATANTFAASWEAIENAKDYTITFNGQTITENVTSIEFTGLDFDTTYEISVVANPADATTYAASKTAVATATTEKRDGTSAAKPYVFTRTNEESNLLYFVCEETGDELSIGLNHTNLADYVGTWTLNDGPFNGQINYRYKKENGYFDSYSGEVYAANRSCEISVEDGNINLIFELYHCTFNNIGERTDIYTFYQAILTE